MFSWATTIALVASILVVANSAIVLNTFNECCSDAQKDILSGTYILNIVLMSLALLLIIYKGGEAVMEYRRKDK